MDMRTRDERVAIMYSRPLSVADLLTIMAVMFGITMLVVAIAEGSMIFNAAMLAFTAFGVGALFVIVLFRVLARVAKEFVASNFERIIIVLASIVPTIVGAVMISDVYFSDPVWINSTFTVVQKTAQRSKRNMHYYVTLNDNGRHETIMVPHWKWGKYSVGDQYEISLRPGFWGYRVLPEFGER